MHDIIFKVELDQLIKDFKAKDLSEETILGVLDANEAYIDVLAKKYRGHIKALVLRSMELMAKKLRLKEEALNG